MSEIKFRAWDEERRHFEYRDMETIARFGWPLLASGALKDPQRFTGLKDKNGVEIYEGDIVDSFHEKWPNERPGDYRANGTPARKVKWITSQHHNGWNIYHGKKTQYEVIGNIYENPELLEKTS